MMRLYQEDCDYIITHPSGVIDSFSPGISSLLNLPATSLRTSLLNVQILAPELLDIFSASLDRKHDKLAKYKEPGGHSLYLILPKNFDIHQQMGHKKVVKGPDCTPRLAPRVKFAGEAPLPQSQRRPQQAWRHR